MFFDAPMVRYFTDDSTSTESSDEEEFNIRTVEKIGRKRRIPTRSMNNSNTRLKVPKTKDDSKEPRRSPRRPGILREVANVSVSPPKKRPITQLEPIDPPNPYSANVVNDRFQRLMRDYTNLYFYLSMPDSTGFCKRPKYQPFMHRNLYYMKQRSLAVKREYNRSAVAKPRPSSVASCPKAKASSSKFCWEKSSQTSETTTGSTRTLTVKFSYIRHSDLPGHRTAKIQLFIATQTNGSYAKIEKLPSACFDMPMNEKLTVPISIDLPPTVSLDSNDDVEMKCHYLVTRVWFSSGQSSITSSGKSLRNVPSRKAMLCDKGKSLRSSPTKSSRLKQDEMLMFGAKQLTEITKETQDVLDGDGGIVFIESERLDITGDEWKSREDFIPELLRLAKKFHSNPFITLSVVEDSASNESSCSDTDSEQSSPTKHNILEKSRSWNKVNFAFEFPRIAYQFAMESDDFPVDANLEEEKLHNVKSLLLENDQKPSKQDWEGSTKKVGAENRFKENHKNMLTKWEEDPQDESTLPPPPKTYMIRILSTPQKCYFCSVSCFSLMALMKHLKLCHPRFHFVYRPNLQVGENQTLPGITVTLNTYYDGSNEINPMSHYIKSRVKEPQQRPPNNIVTFLVIKNKAMMSRKVDKNMKVIISKTGEQLNGLNSAKICDRELKMIYFDERHRHPTIPFKRIVFANDGNAKSINHSWLLQLMKIKIDEIKDLLDFEKEFMLLWNKFLLESRVTAPAHSQLYRMCRTFLEKYRLVMIEKNLFVPWASHIAFLSQRGLLDWSQVYDLIMRTEFSYDPLQDPQHILSKYKHKIGQKGRGMDNFEEMLKSHRNTHSNMPNGVGLIPSFISEIKQRLDLAETGSSSSSSTSTSTRSSMERDIPIQVQPNSAQPQASNSVRCAHRRNGEKDLSMFL